ncbi:hypothetical protein O0L34_g4856 [Tuta absoluta]|nr:hypothetical protein O0L34_g4856 [Tuta absoluta]
MLFFIVLLTAGLLANGNPVDHDLALSPMVEMDVHVPRFKADDTEPSTVDPEDASDPAFKTIAEAALQKYKISQNRQEPGTVTQVKSVFSNKPTDLYKIFFDATLGDTKLQCYSMNASKTVMDSLKVSCASS